MELIFPFLAMLILGLPMAYAMVGAVLVFLFFQGSIPFQVIPQRMVVQIDSYSLLALPFFLLMGELMNSGGITDRIFRFARQLVGHVAGGLGHVNIIASIIFSGMSGAMAADAAGLGLVEIRAMKKAGYDVAFSAAVTAASSTIGPVIPPSIMMVIYGYIAGESIGQLFIAGFIPGLIMGLSLMVGVYIISKRRKYPIQERATLSGLWKGFKGAFLALSLPVILVGGILSGFFNATEAAVIGANYAFVLAVLVYKEVHWHELAEIFIRVAVTSSVILFLIAAAAPLSWCLAWELIPQTIAEKFITLSNNPYVILLMINLVLLFLGSLVETSAIMILMIPIMLPVIEQFGINPVQFGVVMILNLLIGTLTPPMGLGLFIMSQITGLAPMRVFKEAIPFIVCLLIVLAMITYFPRIVMFLPSLIY